MNRWAQLLLLIPLLPRLQAGRQHQQVAFNGSSCGEGNYVEETLQLLFTAAEKVAGTVAYS